MKYYLLLTLLFLSLSISSCIPNSDAPVPDGFINLNSTVPSDEFLKVPVLSMNGQYLVAMGGFSREDGFGSLYVIDTNSKQMLFRSEEKAWDNFSLSPDGQQIVACYGRQLYLIDWKKDTTTYLTEGCFPTWSSDGGSVAFVWYTEKHKQIKVYNLTTRIDKIIYEAPIETIFIGFLDWSPTQNKLLFVMTISDSVLYTLHTIDIDGSDLQKVSWGKQDVWSPNFSYDGSRVMYIDGNIPLSIGQELRVIDGKMHCHKLETPAHTQNMSISADGTKIAFGTSTDGIWVADTATVFGNDFWENGEPCTAQAR